MRESASAGNCAGLLDCDLLFHLELCELSGNPHIMQHERRILLPFFAFGTGFVSESDLGVRSFDADRREALSPS